ncbi:MAG: MBL fold metallo-hydrolase [Patescibacteria group bacterium]
MQIIWYGQSCFKIVSGGTTIILDPFNKDIGLTPPRGKVDVVFVSDGNLKKDDYSQLDSAFVIAGAGEYEVGGMHINGASIFHLNEKGEEVKKSTMYIIDVEGIRVCHLADFSEDHVRSVLDKMGQVDILMIPVGGGYLIGNTKINSLGYDKAVDIIGDIDPRVVIPMFFKVNNLKISLDDVSKFLKSSGASNIEAVDKFTVKKKDLPQDGRDVILMKLA